MLHIVLNSFTIMHSHLSNSVKSPGSCTCSFVWWLDLILKLQKVTRETN